MKISLNWIKDYINLDELSTDDIVERLTMSGLEVEDVFDQKKKYENFVVGLVKEKSKHPDADRLSVCIVNNGEEDFNVVCGAPNVEAGQKVVFAPIGSIIPKENLELKKAKIRGVESNGMICAEDELEISDDHSGIMVLDENQEEGTPITEALNLNDVILDIAVTPNRPDALSHIGVARDLAAIYNRELRIPKVELKEAEKEISNFASIEIKDKVNCPRYSAKVVREVTIKESPEWLKNKLIAVGLRPINNVVDITNFIMHEIGQPLHAFDLDRLAKNKIVVRSTPGKSKFTTLDSKERELPENTLMICDGEREVAIAGVMGGENSEVGDSTKNILIESAFFHPSSVRKTSKSLMLSSDSSYRFERGTDPSITVFAAQRAAYLIAELAGGKIAKDTLDAYPKKIKALELKLRIQRVNKILGYDVPKDEIIRILQKLGINILKDFGDALEVVVPTFRSDIEREVDLIEEIARIAGFDRVPAVAKINITLEKKEDELSFEDKVRESAISLGLHEIINNPLLSRDFAEISGTPIKIANPQSKDMSYLRTSLAAGVLPIVSKNIKKGEKDLALFEIGETFNLLMDGDIKSFKHFTEQRKLIFLLTGKKALREWYSSASNYDYFDLKGLVNSFYQKFLLDNVLIDSYNAIQNSIYEYHFTKNFNNITIGFGGKVNAGVLAKFDIGQDVYCFEFDIDELKRIPLDSKVYSAPLKYPKILRDFAFIFDNSVSYDEVKGFIKTNGSSLLRDVELFDLFSRDELGAGKKSMAFNLEYYDENRTLTEDEVDQDFQNLIKLVQEKFEATLRGN